MDILISFSFGWSLVSDDIRSEIGERLDDVHLAVNQFTNKHHLLSDTDSRLVPSTISAE
jgi:hypothetical protein